MSIARRTIGPREGDNKIERQQTERWAVIHRLVDRLLSELPSTDAVTLLSAGMAAAILKQDIGAVKRMICLFRAAALRGRDETSAAVDLACAKFLRDLEKTAATSQAGAQLAQVLPLRRPQ